MTRLQYLYWALRRAPLADKRCPACGDPATRLVRRKALVTALRHCTRCSIRFRTPKDDPETPANLYVNETYKQGFTTDLPSDAALKQLLESNFAGTEKDFTRRIEVLKACGLRPGSRILDFGASWGYGSWQFTKAGFEVFSYEIGRERARYAQEKLGCNVIEDPGALRGTMDCVFACHVIEHLPDPALLFNEAQKALKPTGVLVCYCPNGDPSRENQQGIEAYDKNWGKVHPLMITPAYMKREAARRGFPACNVFATPVLPEQVQSGNDGQLGGEELLTVAYRSEPEQRRMIA